MDLIYAREDKKIFREYINNPHFEIHIRQCQIAALIQTMHHEPNTKSVQQFNVICD